MLRKPDSPLKIYRERLKTFKRHGYDMVKARAFVIKMSGIKGGDILEIGTGRGHCALGLAQKGFRFTTIELDPQAMSTARHNLREAGILDRVRIKSMNAEQLLFKDNAFDHVISVNFMHHAQHPKMCLGEMIRVAKGSIVIADLNKRGEAIMDKVHQAEGHTHTRSRVTLTEIKEYLGKHGLRTKVYRDTCQTVILAQKG